MVNPQIRDYLHPLINEQHRICKTHLFSEKSFSLANINIATNPTDNYNQKC